MNIFKTAYKVEMSLDIPDSEKESANSVLKNIEAFSSLINSFDSQLDILHGPFENNEEISVSSVQSIRGVLKRYSDQLNKDFYKLEQVAALIVNDLDAFSSDPKILELIGTFVESVDKLDERTKNLVKTMDNWNSKTYRDDTLSDMNSLKGQLQQLENLLFDRIIKHINTNILAKNWVNSMNEKLKNDIKREEPNVVKLYKEREDILNNIF